MLDLKIIPLSIKVIDEDIFTNGRWAKRNKNSTLQEYESEVAAGRFTVEEMKITHIITLSCYDYFKFGHYLLADFLWLSGLGGHDLAGVRLGVIVQSRIERRILVDPQGHGYARYVGLPTGPTYTKK